jgi:trehalose 6-phosphate synthase
LAAALRPALEESGGLWIGSSAESAASPDERLDIHNQGRYSLATTTLSKAEEAGFYLGFSNRSLWPLFHGRIDLVHYDSEEFKWYRSVNEKFARLIAPQLRPTDLVWIHDYHFMLLARDLRKLGVKCPIGFFLHIPFPPADLLATLPWHKEIVEALTACDLVGFQTRNDVRNFREYILRRADGEVISERSVRVFGRKLAIGAFPVGIDTERYAALATSANAQKFFESQKKFMNAQLAIVGADRLDYTKGLIYRLRAYEHFLETYAEYHKRVSLVQIAAPSRKSVPEYRDLRRELEGISGRINARYAEIDWTPLTYLNQTFSPTRLAALFRFSRVGLVTPLRDGMNLVAKEFVASQDANDPGVLVLSDFAGAAEELKEALIVNPYDVVATAEAIRTALEMPLKERSERWTAMMAKLRAYDVHRWRKQFLSDLARAAARSDPAARKADRPVSSAAAPRPTVEQVKSAVRRQKVELPAGRDELGFET